MGISTTSRKSRPAPLWRRAAVALTAIALAAAVALALAVGLDSYGSRPQPAAPVGAPALIERSSGDEARLVSLTRGAGRTVDLTIDSPALGRRVATRVLLPPGFDEQPERRWPTLYLLHGCCISQNSWQLWTRKTDVELITASLKALVVMPEGGPVSYYSNWWRSDQGTPAAWETFHLTELRELLERELRANGRRAVAGVSMGGTGALLYAGRNPGMFQMAASFSGRLDTQSDPLAVLNKVGRFAPDPKALWGDPVTHEHIWTAHNPYRLIRSLPRGFPVYISCGDGRPGPMDRPQAAPSGLEASFDRMAAAYIDRARDYGLHVTAHRYGPGTHSWRYWERELATALPLLAAAIEAG
ncbi:alpha/beta hydrolase [Streptomyces gobiensis]|uniref:alpha/beta hydrolase n=1 Tax=Streptomyces gobiensis TaxID=2875706 RepID=UPI001E3D01D6|nr:alpha/beta hydrolase family protein [Streptomyces gobiensis]UGY92950.1 esterase family protein [Streptomyces gobiensis]